jgi:hypothetical protein
MLGTAASMEENGDTEAGTQKTGSRDGTDVGRASPRICVTSPGTKGAQLQKIKVRLLDKVRKLELID